MEFPGRGNEIKKQPPHSIEGLVTSGFIDESGQLTERTRRAIPRGGVEIVTPVQIQEHTIGSHPLENIQQPCRVVADKALFLGHFLILSRVTRKLSIRAIYLSEAILLYVKIQHS